MIELSCLEKLAIKVLRKGHVPEHIAFIMDGNRRYAKNEKKKALSGHEEGTRTLKKCLLYCLELGVQYASFYAFSLENFNRKEEEV
jgi:ditrans,polycis-polyprenyl diphosphate synthase